MIRKCLQCKKDFITYPNRIKSGNGKFCSRFCFHQKRKIRFLRKCLTCGKKFEVHPYRKLTANYCSRLCQGKSWIGKNPWNKGKPHLGKERHPLWGKYHSEETKKKMSESKKSYINRGGKFGTMASLFRKKQKKELEKREQIKRIYREEKVIIFGRVVSPRLKRE